MRSRIQPWFAVVLVLMGIGLASQLYQGAARSLIVPLVLVAVVFLLYKFPPSRWKKPNYRGNAPKLGKNPDIRASAKAKSERRRSSPFTVIEGRKSKEDEPPRYH
ncbi:hypothetical protein [Cohnella sp.]|uniref:hypothetical protein n=1 Tax=Cohnella sp. TaxID=1883426 RepID=UPI0035695913